ncbi:MAG: hypothetical protein DBY43_06380 [Clostridiaceae bacterium]|nr:MAG: hypothetical protein DBY43_06380 [Clostridiaceae bacterium]
MTNKMMNEKGFSAKMETIDEIVFDCMKPRKLTDDQNNLVLAFKRSTTQTIYPAYSLDYRWGSYYEGGGAVAQKIKKAVKEKTPVKWEWAYYDKTEEAMKRFRNHYFIGASDVDTTILVASLEKYKKVKEAKKRYEEKNKALDEVRTKLKALEKEIEEIQKK